MPIVLIDPKKSVTDAKGFMFSPGTTLNLSAGATGTLTGSLSLASLKIGTASLNVSLAANPNDASALASTEAEEDFDPTSGSLRLSAKPGTAVVVYDSTGQILASGVDYLQTDDASGTTISLPPAVSAALTPWTVDYQAATSPPNPRSATFCISFNTNQFTRDDGNNIGAVTLTDFIAAFSPNATAITVSSQGILAGALSATLLGSPDPTVVLTLGSSSTFTPTNKFWLPIPTVAFDSNLLSDLTQNIPFDISTIAQGVEEFLQLLQTGLTSQFLDELPIVGKDFSLAGSFIGKINNEFVQPFTTFLKTNAQGNFTQVQNLVDQYIFHHLGPAGLNILGARQWERHSHGGRRGQHARRQPL